MWTVSDYRYMARALEIAQYGLYSTDPNPRVGCVIVKNDQILSEGWHQKTGQPHAEIEALNKLIGDPSGSTCYISLEPCVHHGRTPPCVEALIAAEISSVIVAAIDPNPLVAGKGLRSLNEAGIKTASGLMAEQARKLNPGFEMRMAKKRPFLRCKLAMSLDGKTALANGNSQWISSVESRTDVHKLRARSSAIMTSIATVMADDPSINVRLSEPHEWCRYSRQPLRIVLDYNLAILPTAKILNLPGETVIFHSSEQQDKQDKLANTGVETVFIEARKDQQFLHAILNYLAAEKEVNEILLEAGAGLSGQMLQADLIDECIIYIAPTLLGHDARDLFHLPLIEEMSLRYSLNFSDIRFVGQDIRITATINRDK